MGDLRGQLIQWASKTPGYSAHVSLFYEKGCAHPPYNDTNVRETLALFESEILPFSPITDPLGRSLVLKRETFPKLLNIKRVGADRGKAKQILKCIERGELDTDAAAYGNDRFTWERDRIRTLLWLPEVLSDPDAIFASCHKKIEAEEVYVRVYDKLGSTVKLAFIGGVKSSPIYVVTSFLTSPEDAAKYVQGKPIYMRPDGNVQKAIAAHAAIASPVSAPGPG